MDEVIAILLLAIIPILIIRNIWFGNKNRDGRDWMNGSGSDAGGYWRSDDGNGDGDGDGGGNGGE
jgi:hypothetical protein